ncbi:MAG TPA: histidine phosphatase family protein [Terracidiphilus sp.]
MKLSAFLQRCLGMSLVLACLLGNPLSSAPQTPQVNGETIVLIRHGEKPAGGLGQLSCKGLNRSLALPSLLIGRYGKPDFIYAPNPNEKMNDGHILPTYPYLRPLATIEPTAIRLGMPVNTDIGYTHIARLQHELLQSSLDHKLIFVVWEHFYLREFAEAMLTSYGSIGAQELEWPESDFETIYVFHITRTGKNGATHATLEIQKEDLGETLKDTCPGPQ